MNNNDDRLLTANELADFLDVPIKTLYAWRYSGEGPIGFRASRHIRYRWADVEGWIEDRIASTCHPRLAQSP
jgi:predicted DNA-binding transcriptional regulator AlpA